MRNKQPSPSKEEGPNNTVPEAATSSSIPNEDSNSSVVTANNGTVIAANVRNNATDINLENRDYEARSSVHSVPVPPSETMEHDQKCSSNASWPRSLIRQERARFTPSTHSHYYYNQHTFQESDHVSIEPSSTGNDPLIGFSSVFVDPKDIGSARASSTTNNVRSFFKENLTSSSSNNKNRDSRQLNGFEDGGGSSARRSRTSPKSSSASKLVREGDKKEFLPSGWTIFCRVLTFPVLSSILKVFGISEKKRQDAWREKIGLNFIIAIITALIGFCTFGLSGFVCGDPGMRIHHSAVPSDSIVIHGRIFNVSSFHHTPLISPEDGIHGLAVSKSLGATDGSLLFQNVNNQCKGLIIPDSQFTNVVADDHGRLPWYFPCTALTFDGRFIEPPIQKFSQYTSNTEKERNMSIDFPIADPKYGCHLSRRSRNFFYKIKKYGDVYYTWDDLDASPRNLAVIHGDVVDLDRLKLLLPMRWRIAPQLKRLIRPYKTAPDVFSQASKTEQSHMKQNDLSLLMVSSKTDRRASRCLVEIAKVGVIDTDTLGCIASSLVLFISMTFICSIVIIKFLFAVYFEWFLSWRMGLESEDAIQVSATNIATTEGRQPDDENTIDQQNPQSSKNILVSNGMSGNPDTVPTSQSTLNYILPHVVMMNNGVALTTSSETGSSESPDLQALMVDQSYQQQQDLQIYGENLLQVERHNHQKHELLQKGQPKSVIFLVTAYSESDNGLRQTLDGLVQTDYPDECKLILVICDGLVTGTGNSVTTPEIVLDMMEGFLEPISEARTCPYLAVGSGEKRINRAKVYCGYYQEGQHRNRTVAIPMMTIVKCGLQSEADTSPKPGNRGKRDSQIILMSFLQRVLFDERMTNLENEMYLGFYKLMNGSKPDNFEAVLMVDADTKVYTDSLRHMIQCLDRDPSIMGLCGETRIENKRSSWVTMIQVFEYFISHHYTKSFESVFGGVTCLPGCFSMYRIKAPKGPDGYWVPILANPDVVERYSMNTVDSLHIKNLLLLGEDRYLTTLMLKTFSQRKQVFVPQAKCKTVVPTTFRVLLDQRRRWINSTIHNLLELLLVRDLCGVFCISMQFVVFIELIGTVTLPAALVFTIYLLVSALINAELPMIPMVLLSLILGIPAVLIIVTGHKWVYLGWMMVYLLSLPIWNFILPLNACKFSRRINFLYVYICVNIIYSLEVR